MLWHLARKWATRCSLHSGLGFCAWVCLTPCSLLRCAAQAGSVEECCDWAIAIREAIAVATGKALAYDDEDQG